MIGGVTLSIEPVEDLNGVLGILRIVSVHENGLVLTRLAGKPVKIGLHVEEHGGFALCWKRVCLCLLFSLNLLLRHLFLLGLWHEAGVWELIHSADGTRNAEHEFLSFSFKGCGPKGIAQSSRICARVNSSLLLLLVLIAAANGWEVLPLGIERGALA